MRITALPTTIATVLGLAIAGIAFSSDIPSFEDVDANKDGKISESEAAKVSDLDFAAADANHDGVLTRNEYESAVS